VIVEAFMLQMQMQITGEPIGEVRAVSNMHQRKAEMARQADAFIALPGKNYFFLNKNTTSTIFINYCMKMFLVLSATYNMHI